MKIQFCGAAAGVTGSCHLIKTSKYKILLDCGLFQGSKSEEAKNFADFPFEPEEIDYVILSHAHIDHCGRIPLRVKHGFKGEIICTDATADLLDVMLKDSGFILEKEAEWKNRKAERAGRPLSEPLYTFEDAVASLKHIKPILYDQLFIANDEMKIVFNDAGHILGSAIIELWVAENDDVSKIVYTGDLGVMERPLLRNPTIIKKADHVIMETTYGNRLHPANSTSIDELLNIVLKTTRRGGTVVIPSFAVGRTQELVYEFNRFYDEHPELKDEMDNIMVYVDSPMATTATEVFRRNAQVFNEETKNDILNGDNPLDFKNLRFTRTTEESRDLNFDLSPKVIISASGMCEAGRIRHHLKHNLWDARSSIVFVGYQAEGTLGRNILNGAEEVVLFGEEICVNAEIHNLEGFSGHADRDGLLEWLKGFQVKPKNIFLVHGETNAKLEFVEFVKEELGFDCVVAEPEFEYTLEKDTVLSKADAIKETVEEKVLDDIKGRVSKVHYDLERMLYTTHLAMSSDAPATKIAELSNIVLELEKASISLGSILVKGDRDMLSWKE
jgi:metallo-beta-lactamase family protein